MKRIFNVIGFSLVTSAVVTCLVLSKDNIKYEYKPEENILITAKHLDSIEGYTKIYGSRDRDVAYYVKDNPSYSIIGEDTVSIEGLKNCKVVEKGEGYFIIETSTPELIYNGMSGSRVYNKNKKAIGFISQLINGGRIKCLTLE